MKSDLLWPFLTICCVHNVAPKLWHIAQTSQITSMLFFQLRPAVMEAQSSDNLLENIATPCCSSDNMIIWYVEMYCFSVFNDLFLHLSSWMCFIVLSQSGYSFFEATTWSNRGLVRDRVAQGRGSRNKIWADSLGIMGLNMVSSPPPSRWVLHTKLSVVSIRQNKHGPQSKVCTMLHDMLNTRRCLRVFCHDQRLVLQASLWMARLKQDLLSYSFHGVPQDWEDGVLTAQSWVMQPEISVRGMHLTSFDQMIQMEDHISREIAITTGMEATRPWTSVSKNIQGTLTNVMDCFFAHQWKKPNNQNRQWLRDIGIYWNAGFTIVLWLFCFTRAIYSNPGLMIDGQDILSQTLWHSQR